MKSIAGSKAEEIVMTTAEKLFAQGIEKNQRTSIMTVLRARFDEIPEGVKGAIRNETNAAALEQLLVLAASAESLAAFRLASGKRFEE